QSFFALSIGVTAMLTYASYLDRRTNLVQSGISVVLMNIAVSIMAGLAIFPAMSSFGMESEGGPSLLFIVLPQLFNNMAFGKIFYILFLILFLFATITSSVVMLEIHVGNITNQKNTNRTKFSVIIGILTFIVGIPSALSYGSLSDTLIFGKTVFDLMDFLVSNILMPLGCLALSIFTGYVLDKKVAKEQLHINEHNKTSLVLFRTWLFLLRYILPVIILIVCLAQFL
ncbi:MAG: sodium-dependent transporter, partial [Gemella haemolysans]|nr:sodium-dependent transporter [Gemella haemolysans]